MSRACASAATPGERCNYTWTDKRGHSHRCMREAGHSWVAGHGFTPDFAPPGAPWVDAEDGVRRAGEVE